MQHSRSTEQSTENQNKRSTHINKLGDPSSDHVKPNINFNCHNSSNATSIQNSGGQRNCNGRDIITFHTDSTLIQIDTLDSSTSFPHHNSSAENRSPNQFP